MLSYDFPRRQGVALRDPPFWGNASPIRSAPEGHPERSYASVDPDLRRPR